MDADACGLVPARDECVRACAHHGHVSLHDRACAGYGSPGRGDCQPVVATDTADAPPFRPVPMRRPCPKAPPPSMLSRRPIGSMQTVGGRVGTPSVGRAAAAGAARLDRTTLHPPRPLRLLHLLAGMSAHLAAKFDRLISRRTRREISKSHTPLPSLLPLGRFAATSRTLSGFLALHPSAAGAHIRTLGATLLSSKLAVSQPRCALHGRCQARDL